MKQIMGIFRRKEIKRERKSAIIELLRFVAIVDIYSIA